MLESVVNGVAAVDSITGSSRPSASSELKARRGTPPSLALSGLRGQGTGTTTPVLGVWS